MLTRLRRLFRAMFSALIGQTEGQMPIAMLEESVREMLDNVRGLRDATATAIAFEMKASRDLEAQDSRLASLDRQAEDALVKLKDEKLARRALQLRAEAASVRDRARQLHEAARLRAANARAKLQVEEAKVQEKIRRLGELKAVHEMNEAQRRLQQISDEFNIDGAVSSFDQTAGSIQEEADKLQAMDSLAVSEGEDLDRKLAALGRDAQVDEALDALKARVRERGAEAEREAPERQKISSAFDES
jgi:phage shock protein A